MSAVISDCGKYRYRLERDVGMAGPVYAFFGVNPSTADASVDDATVRKWIGFTKVWGGSRFIVGNLLAYRATDVRALRTLDAEAIRWVENERHLIQIALDADILVPCWGSRNKLPPNLHQWISFAMTVLRAVDKPIKVFGLTASGDPKHPLMLGYDTPLTPWPPVGADNGVVPSNEKTSAPAVLPLLPEDREAP